LQQGARTVVRADQCSIWGLGWQWEQWKEDQRGKGPLVVLKGHRRFSGISAEQGVRGGDG